MARLTILTLALAATALASCGEKHSYRLATRTPAPVYWGWSQKMPGAACEPGEAMVSCSLAGYGVAGAAGAVPLPFAIAETTSGGQKTQTCSVSPPAAPYEPPVEATGVLARVVCARVVEAAAP